MSRAGGSNLRASANPSTSVALANLRGVFILILVSFHSCLAYVAAAPARAPAFDEAPYAWLAFPVVDSHRFFGFDLYCAWEDVQVMAMMYFLSGVFVGPSLRRKGPLRFALDRLWRLGPPLALSLFALTPLALYPVFARANPGAGLADYLAAYARLPFVPVGPQWFLWLLLAFGLLAAAVHALFPAALDRLGALAGGARRAPAPFLWALAAAAVVAYLPLALGYGAFDWFEGGPVSFQKSRPLLYGVFFIAGVAAGANGIAEGLLGPQGALGRLWLRFALAAPLALFVWMGVTGVAIYYPQVAPWAMPTISGLAYVGACVLGVMSLLGASLRFGARPFGWLGLLGRNAMGIFALHYAPMVWLQDALTGWNLPAAVKCALVFLATLALTLGLSAAIRRQGALAWLIGEAPQPAPKLAEYASS